MTNERPTVEGVTVDGPTSRDLDDAIWVRKQPDGWIVHVSISDVSHRIPKGSDVDQEAFRRVFTRYFAWGNRPMLPRSLADDALSLQPRRERMTVTSSITLGEDLEVRDIQIRKTKLSSKKRLTYAEVDEILHNTGHDYNQYWTETFELAQRLLQKRRGLGALAVFDLKKGLKTDEDGEVVRMPTGQHYSAHLIVQELMILMNTSTTALLRKQGVPLLFRNHTTRQEDVREHYLKALSELLIEPTAERLDSLGAECRHIMNRARYEPDCTGHFALNLPEYTHWTSPIRRYADLVNHRMLDAWLRNEPMPYAHDELKAIGDHLNAASDEVRDGKGARFKDRKIRQLTNLNPADVPTLLLTDFQYLLEKLIDKTIPIQDLHFAAIKRRINDSSVDTVDIARVLFADVQGHDTRWNPAKEAALQWLQNNPTLGSSVINNAYQALGTPPLEELQFEYRQDGDNHAPVHRASVSMTLGERTYRSLSRQGATRKEAEQAAIINLLAKIAEIPEPPKRERNISVDPTVIASNMKGFLLEWCQKRGIAFPEYASHSSGPPHAPEFTCIAKFAFEGTTYESEPSKGASKKEAEQRASQSLLEKLPETFASSKQDPKVVTTEPTANPVGALQEWCQGKRIPPPEYTFDRSGPDNAPVFAGTCTVVVDGKKKEWKGAGTTKQAAKADAAKAACAELLK